MSPAPSAASAAYLALAGENDPAASWFAAGAIDCRWDKREVPGARVVRGAGDLNELHTIVERVTGPGSWPAPSVVDGEARRRTVDISRPADLMRLVTSLQGEIRDHSSMWRTWKTTVEVIAAATAELKQVTLEAVLATEPS